MYASTRQTALNPCKELHLLPMLNSTIVRATRPTISQSRAGAAILERKAVPHLLFVVPEVAGLEWLQVHMLNMSYKHCSQALKRTRPAPRSVGTYLLRPLRNSQVKESSFGLLDLLIDLICAHPLEL